MARLYPPVIEEVLPAFCLNYDLGGNKTGASINIDFNLNRAVANTEISGIAIRLRTISTNKYIITENFTEGKAISWNLNNGTCVFQITSLKSPEILDLLKVGQYYKVQIAFLDLSGDVGYWSTVATIKCVAKPIVRIANFNANDVNIFNNEIVGEYIQDTSTGDSSEKVYSYRFQLLDSEGNSIVDTGVLLHNSNGDIASNSSIDKLYCYEELNENETYYLEYSITTINGLYVTSPRYQIVSIESIPLEKDLKLVAETGLEDDFISTDGVMPWEEGVIKLYLDYIDKNSTFTVTGNFIILRASSKDNFKSWLEIRRFRLVNAIPNKNIFYDYTVEQGITYKYAVQQYNKQGFYSRKVECENEVLADFEDMFLYDGKRQLKIRFNSKVSSFKNDLQEQKIDTIGSKHPFIFRNGNVCYKEFPVAGLITFQLDNIKFFMTDKDYEQMKLERFEEFSREKDPRTSPIYNKFDLTSDNIMSERYFKLLVLDWLTNGEPKLFRSPTEGNYIVRLLNVSLSPKDELGRMLHEFTSTAYEIADFNYQSLVNLGLLTFSEIDDTSMQWSSLLMSDLDKEQNENSYSISFKNKELTNFQCINFMPGDKIIVTFSDTTEQLEIIINNTGTYIYDGGKPVYSLKIYPRTDGAGDFSRSILLQTKEYNYQEFDTISSVSSITQMGEQLIGPIDNFFEHTVVNSSLNKKDYATANNVSLHESFNQIELTNETFIANKYYILNNNNYELAINYDENEQYYERIIDGDKIKVTELLHLNVRRREIIPIYVCYNLNWNDIENDNSRISFLTYHEIVLFDSPDMRFMVTPYGIGYINNKSIVSEKENELAIPNPTWEVLNNDEHIYAMSINEIVQFAKEKMNADTFCLFEAYIPFTLTSEGVTSWRPYKDCYGDSLGIYDPLYNNGRGGWWPNSYIEYDPTFSITYEDGKEYKIDLSKEPNITFDNIKIPTKLQLGNGVLAEPIYRVQYIDYNIENSNLTVAQAKEEYLQIKKQAIKNIEDYQRIKYNKYLGSILYDYYDEILSGIDNLEIYRMVIRMLTQNAYNQQENNLKNFVLSEQNLIDNIAFQVQWLDLDLMDALGEEYIENYKIYNINEDQLGNEVPKAKNAFDEAKPDINEIVLNDIESYEEIYPNVGNVEEDITNQINPYINIPNNMGQALETIYNRINNAQNEILQLIEKIGQSQNIGQYIELLQEQGKEIFFEEIQINENNTLHTLPIYAIIHKQSSNIENLKSIDVLDNIWTTYFILDEYPLLELTRNGILYSITNKEFYENIPIPNTAYLYNSLRDINTKLENLNNNPEAGIDTENARDEYNAKYTPPFTEGYTKDNSGLYFVEEQDELKLGQINDDNTINYTTLERMIDSSMDVNNSINFENLKNNLSNNNKYNTLPDNIKNYIDKLIYLYVYVQDENNTTRRSLMLQVKACNRYKQTYINTLTEAQQQIIDSTIQMYKEAIISFEPILTDNDREILELQENEECPTMDSILNILSNRENGLLAIWGRDYQAVPSGSSDEGSEPTENQYSVLLNSINNFNNLIKIKNKAIKDFNAIRSEIITLSNNTSNTSAANNLRQTLQEKRNIYNNALNQIDNLKNYYNEQLTALINTIQNDDAYIKFLQTYLNSLSLTQESKDQYSNYRSEANNMANAILDENNNYQNQSIKVTNAWRNFLNILANTYKIEVKERFG